MKKLFAVIVFAVFAAALSGAELAVDFKGALAKTPPMADVVNGWVRNGSSKKAHIGIGEVTEENGAPCFKITTTKIQTEFFCRKPFYAKAGQKLEIEITAQGSGYLLASCYSYEASKKFFHPKSNLKHFRLTGAKKVYKHTITLADGKKGQKLAYVLLAVGAAAKSNVTIFDIKARITE